MWSGSFEMTNEAPEVVSQAAAKFMSTLKLLIKNLQEINWIHRNEFVW